MGRVVKKERVVFVYGKGRKGKVRMMVFMLEEVVVKIWWVRGCWASGG